MIGRRSASTSDWTVGKTSHPVPRLSAGKRVRRCDWAIRVKTSHPVPRVCGTGEPKPATPSRDGRGGGQALAVARREREPVRAVEEGDRGGARAGAVGEADPRGPGPRTRFCRPLPVGEAVRPPVGEGSTGAVPADGVAAGEQMQVDFGTGPWMVEQDGRQTASARLSGGAVLLAQGL